MKIAYGLAGEGRGHSTRAIAVGSKLINAGHDVTFFTCCDAIQPLTEQFGSHRIHQMPTPRLQYSSDATMSTWRTSLSTLGFFNENRPNIIKLARILREENYELVISDFEPLLSRASKPANIPYISLSNQAFSKICSLPFKYWWKNMKVRMAYDFVSPEPDYTIVIKAVDYPCDAPNTTFAGPSIRDNVEGRRWVGDKAHIHAYLRPSVKAILPELGKYAEKQGLRVKLYGGLDYDHPLFDNIKSSNDGFIEDMVSSRFVVATGGASLLGELAYTGTPAILIPEPNQIEQEINAMLAQDTYPHIDYIVHHDFTSEKLDEMVRTLHGMGESYAEDGTNKAYEAIEQYMKGM
jgi:uncharacterized protein (TIGR00661 family)